MRLQARMRILAPFAAAAIAAVLLAAGPGLGATEKGTDTKAADLTRIERYLNNLRTLSARFLQSSSDGGVAEGRLYLSRPGRLRVEYDPPTPVLIVSDGSRVHYYDSELRQVSAARLSDTPAAVLVRDKYSLNGDVNVVGYERGPNVIRITLEDAKNPDIGRLTLTLQDNPLVLRQWTVIDAKGIETTVALSETQRDVTLSPKLFEFTDPTKPSLPFGQ